MMTKPHPYLSCAEWVPISAKLVYSDKALTLRERGGTPQTAGDEPLCQCWLRLVSRGEMKPVYKRWKNKFDYMDWAMIFDACFLSANLPPIANISKMATVASKELAKIATTAARLADDIEHYRNTCLTGKVHSVDWYGSVEGQRLIADLRDIAEQSKAYKHERYGIGKVAWEKRIQATKHGLPQFIRFFLAQLENDFTLTGQDVPALSDSDLTGLAIASLNIGATNDADIDKIRARVRELTREIKNGNG